MKAKLAPLALLWSILSLSKAAKGDQRTLATDISGYQVHYEQCVRISDEVPSQSNGQLESITKQYVIFRLCPTVDCTRKYGEYLIDLEAYLDATVYYHQQQQDHFCETCHENCKGRNLQLEGEADDCYTCADECEKIEDMERNGYIDATDFLECQMIRAPDDDAVGTTLYAGPLCSDNNKILIGVFTDERCHHLDPSKRVDDYLTDGEYSYKLSHALLRESYRQDNLISCKERHPEDHYDKEQTVNQLCLSLYDWASKCEQPHGFERDVAQLTSEDIQQEVETCDTLDRLKSGTYIHEEEAGAIATPTTRTTSFQKLWLMFLAVGIVVLSIAAISLRSKLRFAVPYQQVQLNDLELSQKV